MDNDRPVNRDRYGRLLPGTATPKTGGRPKVPRSLRAASRAGEVPGAAWARWYSQRRLRPSQRVSATGSGGYGVGAYKGSAGPPAAILTSPHNASSAPARNVSARALVPRHLPS